MYPQEYIEFLAHFHGDRDYFECHEILEEYWKEVDPGNKSSIWVGFILLAVANYHHRRKNFQGAGRTLQKALAIFKENLQDLEALGIDKQTFLSDLTAKQKDIRLEKNYSSYNIPIYDQSLIFRCKELCHLKNFTWCSDSELTNEDLIHRHSRRDRTAVIQERQTALNKRHYS